MTKKTILLVEDNPDDVTLTLEAFRRAHLANDVVVADDGVAALELLLPPGDRPPLVPALVLLDLKLPRLDGSEVLRRIRADPRTRLQPVVILTTSSEDSDRLKCYESGANSYVRKPVDFVEFVKAATTLGLYWTLVNEPPGG